MDLTGLTSAYTDLYTTMAGNKQAETLQNSLQARSTSQEELMDVCKQFESYFLEQVFQSMWKTIPESETSSNATSTLMDFQKDQMIQAMAAQSTEQNSLGLAQILYEQMKNN
jgi:flagellar protein FlgJ